MSSSHKLLVSGASGHLGQLVLSHLLKKGVDAKRIIATTRDPEKLSAFRAKGVDVRFADFDKPETLGQAFEGAQRMLLISTDAVGSRLVQHQNAVNAAKKAGVQHIVYTSLPNPDRALSLVAPEHRDTEIHIEASGLSYTILRNSLYTDYLIPTFENAVKSGKIYGARGQSKIAYVTREDCAKAAASALSSNDHYNAVLDITGPEALSLSQLAGVFSKISGQSIAAVDVPVADFKGGLLSAGLPAPLAEVLASFELNIKQGALHTVTTAVKELTGDSPKSVAQFFQK